MNPYILESAAQYVLHYRAAIERRGMTRNVAEERAKVAKLFGSVYAAILCV